LGFAQNKCHVDGVADDGKKVHAILEGQYEVHFPLPAILEDVLHERFAENLRVVSTVIDDEERPRVLYILARKDLALLEVLEALLVEFRVDERLGKNARVKRVRVLGAVEDYAARKDVFLVVEKRLYERRFSSARFADDDDFAPALRLCPHIFYIGGNAI